MESKTEKSTQSRSTSRRRDYIPHIVNMAAAAASASASAPDTSLRGLALFELDSSGDLMHVWSYPGLDERNKRVLLARSNINPDAAHTKQSEYLFSRFDNTWYYSLAGFTVSVPKNHDSRVRQLNFVILSTTFNPEKYRQLLMVIRDVYSEKGNLVEILSLYLSAFTSGHVFIPRPPGQPRGEWTCAKYDDRKALLANSSLREVLKNFGAESVILWVAVLLKKRVVVYGGGGGSVGEVQRVVRALPLLSFHRGPAAWNALRPLVTSSCADEISDLEASSEGFIAGTVDADFRSQHSNLIDLYVDLGGKTLSVSEHARTDFGMGKIHKTIAAKMVEQAEAASESAAIKGVNQLSLGMIAKLKTLGKPIPSEALKAFCEKQKYTKSESRFMLNFAGAEGML